MTPEKTNDRWTTHEVPFCVEDGTAFGRYRVESSTDPRGFHLVDLTERGGFGACDCPDFQIRANFHFRRLGFWIPYAPKREGRSDCKHLESAKAHFYQHVTVPLLHRMRHGVEPPKKNENLAK